MGPSKLFMQDIINHFGFGTQTGSTNTSLSPYTTNRTCVYPWALKALVWSPLPTATRQYLSKSGRILRIFCHVQEHLFGTLSCQNMCVRIKYMWTYIVQSDSLVRSLIFNTHCSKSAILISQSLRIPNPPLFLGLVTFSQETLDLLRSSALPLQRKFRISFSIFL